MQAMMQGTFGTRDFGGGRGRGGADGRTTQTWPIQPAFFLRKPPDSTLDPHPALLPPRSALARAIGLIGVRVGGRSAGYRSFSAEVAEVRPRPRCSQTGRTACANRQKPACGRAARPAPREKRPSPAPRAAPRPPRTSAGPASRLRPPQPSRLSPTQDPPSGASCAAVRHLSPRPPRH